MITSITGVLTRVLDDEVRLRAAPFEYSVLVPEFVRRQLHMRIGEELTLYTAHFLEGNQMSPRMTPRLVGFLTESELEFFELLCTVDKFGVRKALKALARPVRDIADAVHREAVAADRVAFGGGQFGVGRLQGQGALKGAQGGVGVGILAVEPPQREQ